MSIISKKKMNDLLSRSNHVTIELIEDSRKSYKIMIIGDKDKVKKSPFEKIVLDFIKEQKEFNKIVDQRLSVLEENVKEIKSIPIIKEELKK